MIRLNLFQTKNINFVVRAGCPRVMNHKVLITFKSCLDGSCLAIVIQLQNNAYLILDILLLLRFSK